MIVSQNKPTLTLIASESGFKAVDLASFLREEELGWPMSKLYQNVLSEFPEDGELLTDTVVAAKENTTRMEARATYSSSDKRTIQGQLYAVLCWANDQRTVVVGFRMVKEDQNQLAVTLDLIDEFLSLGVPVRGVRGDGFYWKENFVKGLKQRHLSLISKPRCDSWWYVGAEEIQLREYAQTLAIESFHYYGDHQVYAKALAVGRYEYGIAKIVVIRPRRSSPPKDWIYLICTDLNMTVRQIVNGYRGRWRIEVVFRDCSQQLGLKSHQGYKQSSERHVALVFLAYNFLSEWKWKEGHTLGYWKRTFSKSYKQERTRLLGSSMIEFQQTGAFQTVN